MPQQPVTHVEAGPLPRRELLALEAANGWLMLGSPTEARAELKQIDPAFRTHPLVLEVEWRTADQMGKPARAWRVARALCEQAPDTAFGWICLANSLLKLDGARAAADVLQSVAGRFPDEPVIAYNLACYLTSLEEWGEASQWLLRAFEAEPEGGQLKRLALVDPDLKPLWEVIGATFTVTIRVVEEDQESGRL